MKCFLCEEEKEKINTHWTGGLCDVCIVKNSHGEPAKLKWLKQHGCVCDNPLMDHGLTNNPQTGPHAGCWNKEIANKLFGLDKESLK